MSDKSKKFIYPFIFSIAVILSLVVFLLIISSQDLGLGGVTVLTGALILIAGIFLPVYCFIYGKKVLKNEEKKFAFSFYNSAVITLFYLVPHCIEGETYLYSSYLFGWCVLWTLLPVIIYKKRDKQ